MIYKSDIYMKQSEKLLNLKKVGSILTVVGTIILGLAMLIPVGLGLGDVWRLMMQLGIGIAFAGLAIRIVRFLYLW